MRKRAAFTLVELLVVISIIALLLSILMPSLAKARGLAQRVSCQSVLKQLMLSTFLFAGDNNGTGPGGNDGGTSIGGGHTHWYIYRDEKVYSGHRLVYDQLKPYVTADQKIWRCPADKQLWSDSKKLFENYKVTSYGWGMGTVHPFTGMIYTPKWKIHNVKSSAKVALYADGCWELGYWNMCHSRGYNVSFVDGHSQYYVNNGVQGRVRNMRADW